MPLALEAIGITKKFPGVLANDHIDFALEQGVIHALLGENGAGKSTLMNILYGLYQPDSGEIKINGQPTRITSPHDAIVKGIGMVHQHFMLVPPLTVAENIMLGQEALASGSAAFGQLAQLDRRSVSQRVRELGEQYGLEVDPEAVVEDLTVGAQQRVEIIKALYREANILILDEPTAVLTPQEADELFVIMRTLVQQGKSIIFITHKLREVLAAADRISVMRAGKMIGSVRPVDATQNMLAEMMVGRNVLLQIDKAAARPTTQVLNVSGLRILDDRQHLAVSDVSLEVRAGEILGIAGVQGNGQTELTEALTGLRPLAGGHVSMEGREIAHITPRGMIESQISHIPEDRHKHGLVLSFSVCDNMALCDYYQAPYAKGIEMNFPVIREHAAALTKQYDVRTPGIDSKVGSLSGGNQQKVIIARELARPVKLLIASQPTRGLDVGSIEFIHRQIVSARDQGAAVLLISAELDEILALSDRIAVMYKGRVLETMDVQDANRERLGLLMAGVTKEGAHV